MGVYLGVLMLFVFFSIGPFILMISLGILASVFEIPSLAIAFWQSVLVYMVLSFIGSILFRG